MMKALPTQDLRENVTAAREKLLSFHSLSLVHQTAQSCVLQIVYNSSKAT